MDVAIKSSKCAAPEEPLLNILTISARARNAALLNAQLITGLDPSTYRGYRLKHAALQASRCTML